MLEGEEKLVRLNLDMTKTSFSVWYQQVQDGLARKGAAAEAVEKAAKAAKAVRQ
jgi:hypothetical protein